MAHSLGDRIRLIRKTNRLNQIEFSNKIGISQGTLSELEKDKYSPSLETILSIHREFQTNLDWFLLGEKVHNFDNNEVGLFQSSLNDTQLKLIKLSEQLTGHDRDEILQFMEMKIKRYRK
jgi:transcriptional regulator with XRE-family HTH domain